MASARVSQMSGRAKSMSRASAERESTLPFLRRPSARCPATKPPTSLMSLCSAALIAMYCSCVSLVRCVVRVRSTRSSHSMTSLRQCLEVRLGAVEIFSCMAQPFR